VNTAVTDLPLRKVFHDAEAPRGELLVHAMVEHDHAIGDVLLEPLPRELPVAALGGDHRGHALFLEPAEEPNHLGAQDRLVRQAAEERLDRVEHHALGADRIDGVIQPDEQGFEVVLAGFLDLVALDLDVIDRHLLLPDQRLEIEAEGAHVLRQLFGGFLEGHEHAGLAEFHGAAHQEFHRHQRLAAACPATNQGGTAAQQTAAGDVVEPFDSRRCFGHGIDDRFARTGELAGAPGGRAALLRSLRAASMACGVCLHCVRVCRGDGSASVIELEAGGGAPTPPTAVRILGVWAQQYQR
jgi:hypothetical protein